MFPGELKRMSRGMPRVEERLLRNVPASRSQNWIVLPDAVAITLLAPRASELSISA